MSECKELITCRYFLQATLLQITSRDERNCTFVSICEVLTQEGKVAQEDFVFLSALKEVCLLGCGN